MSELTTGGVAAAGGASHIGGKRFPKKDGGAMSTAVSSGSTLLLATCEAAVLHPGIGGFPVYCSRRVRSMTTAKATLLFDMVHLLPNAPAIRVD